MTLSPQHRAYLFAVLTVLMWSTVATAFKYTLAYASVLQMLTMACVPGYCEVIDHHTEGFQTIPRSCIKLV
jgi:hypothetical protein